VVAHRTVLLVPMSAHRSPQQTNGKNCHDCYSRKEPHVQILSRYADNTLRFTTNGAPRQYSRDARLHSAASCFPPSRESGGPVSKVERRLDMHISTLGYFIEAAAWNSVACPNLRGLNALFDAWGFRGKVNAIPG
jgi:hypothetical protein